MIMQAGELEFLGEGLYLLKWKTFSLSDAPCAINLAEDAEAVNGTHILLTFGQLKLLRKVFNWEGDDLR